MSECANVPGIVPIRFVSSSCRYDKKKVINLHVLYKKLENFIFHIYKKSLWRRIALQLRFRKYGAAPAH
jgi:hypothetical protein